MGDAVTGGLGAIGGIAGSLIQANAIGNASSAQVQSAQMAQQTEMNMFNTAQGNLQPYLQFGTSQLGPLAALLNPSTAQSTMDQLPGYNFALTQGLRGVQNSAAARGLGVSGAALKGADTFATGMADQTYGSQVNRLLAAAGIGSSAAGTIGNYAMNAGQYVGNAQIGAGNAQAAGLIGQGNAYASIAGLTGMGVQNGLQGYSPFGSPTSMTGTLGGNVGSPAPYGLYGSIIGGGVQQ